MITGTISCLTKVIDASMSFLYFCQVDPFLCLVEDSKLQISDTGSGHQNIIYGSKEDDGSALKCLSEIKIEKDQTKESLVSVIVKILDNILEVNF